jgi:signal transduction histidine kinase
MPALILNVDDDQATRYAVTKALHRADFQVREAANGEEALRLAATDRPDLILLDVHLPGVNGFEVCRRLKADPATASIPVLQVSACFTQSEDRASGLEGGADAYLTAPVEPRELVAQVSALLRARRAEEALKESDRRKNEFLATLAHELRNCLAPARSAVDVLKHLGAPDPTLHWARDVVDRQVRHMARLLDDLLDLTRVGQGKVSLRKGPVELRAVIEHAVEVSRPLVEARRHQLMVSLPADPLRLEADAARLTQVVANLLNNAAKYTDEGGKIWLEAEAQGAEVVLRVRDTGVGIPAEVLPRVFDLYAQEERSRGHAQGGLGIGLALVRSLVELHGGTVTARSEGEGRGSEFTIRLPALSQE